MADETENKQSKKDRQRAEKEARLSDALRSNLRKRKDLQRSRGESAPDAIKNRTRLDN